MSVLNRLNNFTEAECISMMDTMLTATVVLLTQEYIELHTPTILNAKLTKVRIATGTKVYKADKTFALLGTWNQINAAFELLNHWQEWPDHEPDSATQDHNIRQMLCECEHIKYLKLPVTDEKFSHNGEFDRSEELLIDAINAAGVCHCSTIIHAVQELEKQTETLFLKHNSRQKDKTIQVTRIKQVTENMKKNVNGTMVNFTCDSSNNPSYTNFETTNSVITDGNINIKVQSLNSKKMFKTNLLKRKVCVKQKFPAKRRFKAVSETVKDICRFEDDTNLQNLTEQNSHQCAGDQENNSTITVCIKANNSNDLEIKKPRRKPGDKGYWSRVKIENYNEAHQCKICSVVLKSRKRYMEHKRRIHLKEFCCEVCLRGFGYPTDLHRHKCLGRPNKEIKSTGGRPRKASCVEPQSFSCQACDYVGSSKQRLNSHIQRLHKPELSCEQCDKKFGFHRDLQRHKEHGHSKSVFVCDRCSGIYKCQYTFKAHLKTHDDGYIKPMFMCDICSKQFTTKYVLQAHIKAEHFGIKKSYLCTVCGKHFSQRNSFKQHQNAHNGIKPYICELCDKAFTYHKSLKEHQFMHDTIRRFHCQLCDKAFRQRTTLQIHMKVHKTIKDHICPTCGKGFSQKQALDRHERIHTGVKPYKCLSCQRDFGDASTVKRHMFALHKKTYANWKEDVVCSKSKKTDYYVFGSSGQNRTYSNDKCACILKLGHPTSDDSVFKIKLKSVMKHEDIMPVVCRSKCEQTSLEIAHSDSCLTSAKVESHCSKLHYYNNISSVEEHVHSLQCLKSGTIIAASQYQPTLQQQQTNTLTDVVTLNDNSNCVMNFSALTIHSQTQLLLDSTNTHDGQPTLLQPDNILQTSTTVPITTVSDWQKIEQTGSTLQISADMPLNYTIVLPTTQFSSDL